jgi:hypothetical protein
MTPVDVVYIAVGVCLGKWLSALGCGVMAQFVNPPSVQPGDGGVWKRAVKAMTYFVSG